MATTVAPKTAAPTPASNAAAASFASLVDKLDYLGAEGIEQVRRAYKFADEAHLGVTRRSGEPYITHPIAVALQCTEWKLDSQALMASLREHLIVSRHLSKAVLGK
jgi:GTP pyrophosphokinase